MVELVALILAILSVADGCSRHDLFESLLGFILLLVIAVVMHEPPDYPLSA